MPYPEAAWETLDSSRTASNRSQERDGATWTHTILHKGSKAYTLAAGDALRRGSFAPP